MLRWFARRRWSSYMGRSRWCRRAGATIGAPAVRAVGETPTEGVRFEPPQALKAPEPHVHPDREDRLNASPVPRRGAGERAV